MKVLQLIDSLHAGGAERMAVTYANMLQERGTESFLCCTREEGLLKNELNKEVGYLFLDKKSTLHLNPVLQLRKYIKQNEINIVHAHGTSFFTATLQKLFNKKIKIVWHDHYGLSENLEERKFFFLKKCSSKFDAVFSVNQDLRVWAENRLRGGKVFYVHNFLPNQKKKKSKKLELKGGDSFKIICLANLRPQKNHVTLLEAFDLVRKTHPEVTLHLMGKNWEDAYFLKVENFISGLNLKDKVFYYGSQARVSAYLEKCDLGILSSNSEGLPMALLEYGQAGLPVVVTNVGQCKDVVQNFGKVVEPRNASALADAIIFYLKNPDIGKKEAKKFQEHVQQNYTEAAVFQKLHELYINL